MNQELDNLFGPLSSLVCIKCSHSESVHHIVRYRKEFAGIVCQWCNHWCVVTISKIAINDSSDLEIENGIPPYYRTKQP